MKTCIFLDTETTGVNFLTDEIVQASALKVDVISGSVLAVMNVYIEATGKNLDPEALAINGYYKGKWKKKWPRLVKTKKEAAQIMYDFIKDGDYIIAHNAAFDRSFVSSHILKHSKISNRDIPHRWFDSMTIAFVYKYNLEKFKNVSLDYCKQMFNIETPRNTEHDSLQDCYILKNVFFKLMKGISVRLPI
jgi:DNA polymerase III epsilon subunit-like protein